QPADVFDCSPEPHAAPSQCRSRDAGKPGGDHRVWPGAAVGLRFPGRPERDPERGLRLVRHTDSTRSRGGNAEKSRPLPPRFLCVLCVSTLSLLVSSCVKPAPLTILGAVPQFNLIAETGQPFDSHSLDGRIWVADFIYTTCDGPCPMMSTQMRH